MEKLSVLYASNDKYIDIMLASILSLIENSNIKNIDLHIITDKFKKEDTERITKILSEYENVETTFYPLEEFDIEKYNLPLWRNTQVANARLFFQDIMEHNLKDINNILYLDCDTIVVGDLNDLEKYNDQEFAAVKDIKKNSELKKLRLNSYYNSGVIYLNVNKWKDNDCQYRLVKNIKKHADNLVLPDQDLLNITLSEETTTLPQSYNLGPTQKALGKVTGKLYFNKKARQITHQEVEEAKQDPKIIHTYGYGNVKPWHNNNINPLNEEFRKYLKKVNPDFTPEEINGLLRIVANNIYLMKTIIMSKSLIPSITDKRIRKVSEKIKKLK